MDEAGSVNRLDSSGNGRTLAVTGTVNSGVGKINNGSAFVNNSANFLSNNDAVFAGIAPFTVFAWVNITGSLGNKQVVIGRFSAVPPNGWRIILDGSQFFRLETGDGAGGGKIIGNLNIGPIGTGTYHLVIASMIDAANGTLRVDNGTEDTNVTGVIANPGVSLKVGVSDAIPSQLNAIVDEVGVYGRLLSTAEKDALWNAGAGKQYPFT